MNAISEKELKEFNTILVKRGGYLSNKYESYKNSDTDLKVRDKGEHDIVTKYDKENQKIFRRELKKYGYDIIAEESQLPLMVGKIFWLRNFDILQGKKPIKI